MNKSYRNLTRDRTEALKNFQKSLGIRFKSLNLLNTALSHKSYVNESEEELENNEKLEFLGDSFLGLIICNYLYNKERYVKEGTLAKIKSFVVSEPTLYKIGREIHIQDYLLIGKGEEKSGGRYRKALISDSVEALIGAYYLDAGFKIATKLVEKLFSKEILRVEMDKHEKDYKSILQEYLQKRHKILPHYKVVDMKGPDHRKKFFIDVIVKNKSYGPGSGETKKEAEQNAAYIALKILRRNREV